MQPAVIPIPQLSFTSHTFQLVLLFTGDQLVLRWQHLVLEMQTDNPKLTSIHKIHVSMQTLSLYTIVFCIT